MSEANGDRRAAAIDDGYTLAGYIAAQEGVHDDLAFTYRPVDVLTRRRCEAKKGAVLGNSRKSEVDRLVDCEMETLKMIAGQIIEWDLADGKGQPVAIGADAIARYFPGYRYTRIMQIVDGGYASDQRPEGKAERKEEPSADETNDLEAAAKNLQTA